MLLTENSSHRCTQQNSCYLDLKVCSHFNKDVLYITILVQILAREQQGTRNL
jgi:hypothetical protein